MCWTHLTHLKVFDHTSPKKKNLKKKKKEYLITRLPKLSTV